jgi:hypothetical protein
MISFAIFWPASTLRTPRITSAPLAGGGRGAVAGRVRSGGLPGGTQVPSARAALRWPAWPARPRACRRRGAAADDDDDSCSAAPAAPRSSRGGRGAGASRAPATFRNAPARKSAVSYPMPLVAPVTRATLPLRLGAIAAAAGAVAAGACGRARRCRRPCPGALPRAACARAGAGRVEDRRGTEKGAIAIRGRERAAQRLSALPAPDLRALPARWMPRQLTGAFTAASAGRRAHLTPTEPVQPLLRAFEPVAAPTICTESNCF